MAGYSPLYIKGMETGLVQSRQEFILPNDAYPILENAFVWRERIKRKQGYRLLGRLRRSITAVVLTAVGAGNQTIVSDIFADASINLRGSQPNAEIQPGTLVATLGTATFTDTLGTGVLTVSGVGGTSGSIDYNTGLLNMGTSFDATGMAITVTLKYYPNLPVMGLRSYDRDNINDELLVAFDTVYAYIFSTITGGFEEFITGTTWTGNNSDFFWSTNYWISASNRKLFWVTNFSTSDPIRYTDGVTWTNFAPTINAAGDILAKCLCILPFRGRLVTFNTFEGINLAASIQYRQRIRWAAIGSPLVANSWRDDISGKGGFLDIPTSQDIVSVGFVRDNLVIYCESSTWQLRYTGRSIAPFQIEKVNSELGAESTFSAVQFDTSLVGVGDKGIVECDSYKSDRIDIKIPDLVFEFNNDLNGPKRVHGIRDFINRLAFWTYPYTPTGATFPDRRLVYNYENASWAIFTDSLTTLGTYQPVDSPRWQDLPYSWASQNSPWVDPDSESLVPDIIGGNQQGFVEFLDKQTTNDVSLTINNITGNTTTATVITSVNHNLQSNQVVKISNIPTGSPFASSLNGRIFGIVRTGADTFELYTYNSSTGQFSDAQKDAPALYIGGGMMAVRDNFRVVSKKFNMLDEGQNIQIGYIDVLMPTTSAGAITMNMYNDYNDSTPVNRLPQNSQADTFFNSVVPTTPPNPTALESSKYWHRVFCASRAAFLTIEWTLSNAQMVGQEQESNVQIDTQIIWQRAAGNQLPIGV